MYEYENTLYEKYVNRMFNSTIKRIFPVKVLAQLVLLQNIVDKVFVVKINGFILGVQVRDPAPSYR